MHPGFLVKRFLDLTFTTLALLAIWPALLVIAAVIRALMGSPVLFAQTRAGLHGSVFTLYKFRTMINPGQNADFFSDEERLTNIGRFFRKTSLDELPQLWNVLRGEMSLVGPRPLLPVYLSRYTEFQRRRHEVRPGMTGWAQVNGRNQIDWEQRLALDVWYVDHWSLWLDAKILWRTIVTTLRRDGINRDGHATMPEFQGTPESMR